MTALLSEIEAAIKSVEKWERAEDTGFLLAYQAKSGPWSLVVVVTKDGSVSDGTASKHMVIVHMTVALVRLARERIEAQERSVKA